MHRIGQIRIDGNSVRMGLLVAVMAFLLQAAVVMAGTSPEKAPPAAPPQPTAAPAAEEAAKTKTAPYLLANEALLAQAQTLLQDASNMLLGQIRGVQRGEWLLQQAQQATEALTIPDDTNLPAKIDSVDAAKTVVEHRKSQVEALTQRINLIRTEQTSSEEYSKQIDQALSAANAFQLALEQLTLLLQEIAWRVQDGTLEAAKVPGALETAQMDTYQQQLERQRRKLQTTAETIKNDRTRIAERLKQAQDKLSAANIQLASAQENLAQELKRQTLEQEYTGQTPPQLAGVLPQLQEERVWLSRAATLSRQQFDSLQERVAQLDAQVKQLTSPEAEKLLAAQSFGRAEEAQKAAEAVEAMLAQQQQRSQLLQDLQPALQTLIKNAEVFEGDANILTQHLFRMQVVVGLLERAIAEKTLPAEALPAETQVIAFKAARELVVKLTSEASSVRRQAQEQQAQSNEQMTQLQAAQQKLKQQLEYLQKTYEAALRAQKWESELKDLTAPQLVEQFRGSANTLTAAVKALEEKQKALAEARKSAEEQQRHLAALQDPLRESAAQRALPQKSEIRKQLYEFAKLELPKDLAEAAQKPAEPAAAAQPPAAENKPAPAPTPGDNPPPKTPAAAENKPAAPAKGENANPPANAENAPASFDINAYQHLLANRISVTEEQQKTRAALLQALQALDEQLKTAVTAVTDTSKAAYQHQANAVELKKRLGRRQLNDAAAPEGITEALKREAITQLEDEAKALLVEETAVQAQIERLKQPDEQKQQLKKLFADTVAAVGKRLDRLADYQKLIQTADKTRADLSELDLKALKQAARQRLDAGNTRQENFLSLIPSPQADNLTDLLVGYYQELLEAEQKQNVLEDQTAALKQVSALAEEEQKNLEQLQNVLQQQQAQLNADAAEALTLVQLRLQPDDAKDILARFEAQSQRRLEMPTPIPKEARADAVEKAAGDLFERQIMLLTIRNWVDLLKQRLSPTGITREINDYREKLGAVTAAASSLERRIKQITGHSAAELAKLTEAERPQTALATQRFLKGELGVLRADRIRAQEDAALSIPLKLLGIFVAALALSWIATLLIKYLIRRTERGEAHNVHFVGVLALLRTTLKFFIWIGAMLVGASSLGFDVNAVLAGLGIGGLAIAMASAQTVSNIIGGINILLNKPFKIGDYVMFQEKWCGIEEIGLRYCRLRESATKFSMIVPNALLSEGVVINTNMNQHHYRATLKIPLSLNNPPEKVELTVKLIREFFDSYQGATLRSITPISFDMHAFGMTVCCDMHAGEQWDKGYYEVLLGLLKLCTNHGIKFADKPQFLAIPPEA